MNGIIFYQGHNKIGRHDATGAFIPGAKKFSSTHNVSKLVMLGEDHKKNRKLMLDSLQQASGLDVVAYFGHGVISGLPSAGIHWSDLTPLASAISSAVNPGARVLLYACSSGAPDCFAEHLAKRGNEKFTVYGHTIPGHSFTNPYVTRFPYAPDSTPFLVPPGDPLWTQWYRQLKTDGSEMWLRFPFMTKEELHEFLEDSHLPGLKKKKKPAHKTPHPASRPNTPQGARPGAH